jgi:hypothetical protein
MRAERNPTLSSRVFANGHAFARAVMIGSGVAGSWIAGIDIALPWVLGASGFLVTAGIAGATMAEHAAELPQRRPSLTHMLREGVALVRESGTLRALCALTAITAFAHMPVMLLWPPRIEELAGPEMWLLASAWAFLNAVAMMASALVSRLPADVSGGRVLAAITACRGLAVLFAALAVGPFGVIGGILVLEAGFGATDPLLQARMSDDASAAHRATILSVRWMSFTCGGSLGCVMLGLVSRAFGIGLAWVAASAVLFLAAPLFWRFYPPEKRPRDEMELVLPAAEVIS